MFNLLTAEKLKLQHSWKLWVCLGIFIFYPLLQLVGIIGEANNGKELLQSVETVINGATGVLMMAKISAAVQLVIAVFVSFIIGEEFQNGTIRNALSLGRSRGHYYFTKWLVSAGITLIAMVVITLIGVIGYGTAFGFGEVAGVANYMGYAVQVVIVQFLLMLSVTSVFVALVFWTRSSAMAIVWTSLFTIGTGFVPGIFQKFEATKEITWWFTQSFIFYSNFASQEAIHQFPKMIFVSVVTIVVSSLLGYIIFLKTDIK